MSDQALVDIGRRIAVEPTAEAKQDLIERAARLPAATAAGLLVHATLLAELIGCNDETGGAIHALARQVLATAGLLAGGGGGSLDVGF
jgi:hypothetical protein